MDHKKTAMKGIVSIALIALILYFVNLEKLFQTLMQTNLIYFFLAVLSYLAFNVVRVIRLKYMLGKLDEEVSLKELFLPHLSSMLAARVTPGGTGYLIMPFLLEDKEIPKKKSLSSILTGQMVTFVIKILGASLGILYLLKVIGVGRNLILTASLGVGVISFFVILLILGLWSSKARNILNLFTKMPKIGHLFERVNEKLEDIQVHSKKLKKELLVVTSLTIFYWLVAGLNWLFLSYAVNYPLPYVACLFISPLVTIFQFIPVTISGVGLQEGAGILVLKSFGYSTELSLAMLILLRLRYLVVDITGVKELARKGFDYISKVKK